MEDVDNIWAEPKVEIEDTIQRRLLLTSIKPPPALSTDLWDDNDNTSTDPEDTFSLFSDKASENCRNTPIYKNTSSTHDNYESTIASEPDDEQNDLAGDEHYYLNEIHEDLDEYAINSDAFDDIDLFDIDAVLENQTEFLSGRKYRRGRGASTWMQRLEKWAGGVHVDWGREETSEWRILERLGYTRVPLNKETRDYIVQTACNEIFSRREINRLTAQLANARAQLTLLPPKSGDSHSARREALQAKIARIEQMLANQVQWMMIKRAVQHLGRDLELDDLMIRDNCLMRWR